MSFVAKDGTTFETRDAYKKYTFRTFYTFAGKDGEKLVKEPGSIAG